MLRLIQLKGEFIGSATVLIVYFSIADVMTGNFFFLVARCVLLLDFASCGL